MPVNNTNIPKQIYTSPLLPVSPTSTFSTTWYELSSAELISTKLLSSSAKSEIALVMYATALLEIELINRF